MTRARVVRREAKYCFVVPALDGPVSGGTLYNAELCAALAARGGQVEACALGEPRLSALLAAADYVFVDTLYLDALPALASARSSLFLLTHYLPALVAAGRAVGHAELSAPEARALSAAGGFLVTSAFMREALEPLVAPKQAILAVQPGSRAHLAARVGPRAAVPARAVVIANLVPGKGIVPLLEALREAVRETDRFELSVVGRLDADLEYAAHCARLISESATLAARVTLRGPLSHEDTLAVLAGADVLLSASSMESYGMALADARVTGVPILACAGGHSAAHVAVHAGGQLLNNPRDLAVACLELVREPHVLADRIERARRNAPSPRPWALAASELLAQLGGSECLAK